LPVTHTTFRSQDVNAVSAKVLVPPFVPVL